MKRTRLILADDHTLLIDAVKRMLEPEYEVVATFSDGEKLVASAPELSPDVVILDVNMPTMNGLTAGARLKKILPKVKLIFLTMHQDMDTASEAFKSGASGYVLKTSAASELFKAIREVLRGGNFVTPSLSEGMFGSFVQNFKRMTSARDLTLRQKEVLNLLVEGRSMKEVANVLHITPRTVAFHKYTMMEHLNIRSSAELISYGMRHGSTAYGAGV
jgi:DNA-binding NarL/FixJ family response regulator